MGSGVYRLHQGKGNVLSWDFCLGLWELVEALAWVSHSQKPNYNSLFACRYDAATTYGHDAATSATSQWAAPASSLWSSSSMAAAAAAASATPSAQQQYGFQHPLAMAAK